MFIHTKRSLLYTSILMFTAFVSSSFTQDFDQVQIQTIPVSDGVYMLVGRGGNIGVCVGEDGVLLIDSQFAEQTGGSSYSSAIARRLLSCWVVTPNWARYVSIPPARSIL